MQFSHLGERILGAKKCILVPKMHVSLRKCIIRCEHALLQNVADICKLIHMNDRSLDLSPTGCLGRKRFAAKAADFLHAARDVEPAGLVEVPPLTGQLGHRRGTHPARKKGSKSHQTECTYLLRMDLSEERRISSFESET